MHRRVAARRSASRGRRRPSSAPVTARSGPLTQRPGARGPGRRPGAAARAERPGRDHPARLGRPGVDPRPVELAVEVVARLAAGAGRRPEQQRARRCVEQAGRRRFDPLAARRSRARRRPDRTSPRPGPTCQAGSGRWPRPARAADLERGRPSGVEHERVAVVSRPGPDGARPRQPGASQTQVETARPSAGRRRWSWSTRTCDPVRTGCGAAGASALDSDAGDRLAAGQRITRAARLAGGRDHQPQPLAGTRREPVGVADDDVPSDRVGRPQRPSLLGGRVRGDLVDRVGDLLARPAEELDRLVQRRLQPVDPLALLGDPEHAAAKRGEMDGELELGRRADRLHVGDELDPDQPAGGAHVADLLVAIDQRAEHLVGDPLHLLDVLEHAVAEDLLDVGQRPHAGGRRPGERPADVGGRVRPSSARCRACRRSASRRRRSPCRAGSGRARGPSARPRTSSRSARSRSAPRRRSAPSRSARTAR